MESEAGVSKAGQYLGNSTMSRVMNGESKWDGRGMLL